MLRVSNMFVILFALLVIGCASTLPAKVQGIVIIVESAGANCKYLDNVNGASGLYGKGIENARKEALKQALALGATHVVWVPTDHGYGSTQVQGKAYRCPK